MQNGKVLGMFKLFAPTGALYVIYWFIDPLLFNVRSAPIATLALAMPRQDPSGASH